MKKTLLSILVTILSVVFINAQDLGLNEILKKHFAAVGQEKLGKVSSIKMTGKISTQGMEMPFTMYQKRPDKLRFEATMQDMKMVQAFDGTNGYMIAPWTGSSEPQDATEDQLKEFKSQANIDGNLFGYEKMGKTLELLGTEEISGTKVYKLKLTDKPQKEGDKANVSYFYIDASNFEIIKSVSTQNMQGNSVEVETFMSNYKQLDGISWPYSIETKAMGNTMMQMTIENLVFNEDFADDLFVKFVK